MRGAGMTARGISVGDLKQDDMLEVWFEEGQGDEQKTVAAVKVRQTPQP
jgi:hypothetical protein